MMQHLTSATKPEVITYSNVFVVDRAMTSVNMHINFVKFGRAVFEIRKRTEPTVRQTDRQTDTLVTMPHIPSENEIITRSSAGAEIARRASRWSQLDYCSHSAKLQSRIRDPSRSGSAMGCAYSQDIDITRRMPISTYC